MTQKISSVQLTTPNEWDSLRNFICPTKSSGPLATILLSLQDLGAQSAIIEHEYLDRDFTAEFSGFYSKLFARYTKLCKRIHFFANNIASIVALPHATELSEQLEAAGKENYLGFMVVRPVTHARVGRTIVGRVSSPPDMVSKLLVRATTEVHLLGAKLEVEGAPLIQQDTRVGACAQAAIWTAGRHFHQKHRGPWFSVSEITEEALKPVDFMASTALPAGSAHLSLNSMVIALRKMGREPFTYMNPALLTNGATWAINPADAISRYIDSGIPVILGLKVPGSHIGHAVVALGQTSKTLSADVQMPDNPTRAIFCEAFLVNDDQRGAYLRLPLKANSTLGEVPFNIEQHLQYFLIPLPNKVFRPAESAEEIAWDLVRTFYAAEMPKLKADMTFDLGTSADASDAFIGAIAQKKLIARTYLTYGWKYRQRIVRNTCSETLKEAAIRHDLPRFVWVTEFGTFDSMNHLVPEEKRIFGHVVIDAMSSQFHRSALFFHAPGLIKRWFHAPNSNDGNLSSNMIRIKDDVPYSPKVRGKISL